MKMSKKQLKELAKGLNAIYCNSNVYNYENVIYCIQSFLAGNKEAEQGAYRNCSKDHIDELKQLFKDIKTINIDCFKCSQLAYSAGIYGNNGQLYQFDLFKNCNIVKTFYVYY